MRTTVRQEGRPAGVRSAFIFALFPMLGAATPLLALPSIAQEYGARGWAAIAVGQSVGAAASVAIELGWGLTGPQEAASATRGEPRSLLAVSIASRLSVALVALPLCALVVVGLDPAYLLAATLAATATALSGMTANWFFVGLGMPMSIFWSDALPRLLSVLVGVAALTFGDAPLAVYSAFLVLGYMASPVIAVSMVRPSRASFWHAGEIGRVVRRQRVALAGRGLSALYIGLPVAMVQVWAPHAVPQFAATERLMRMGLMILQSVPYSLQRTVGRTSLRGGSTFGLVTRRVLLVQATTGLLGGAVCALALPAAVDLLLAGRVSVSTTAASLAGLIVLFTSVTRGTGMILVARKRVRWVTTSAGTAALVALPLLGVFAVAWGAEGALLALVLAEAAALLVQVLGLRHSRHFPSREASAGAESTM